MRISAAIRGNLTEVVRGELDAATEGIQAAVKNAQQDLKNELRSDVVAAGLGTALSKTWQDKGKRGLLFYPNGGLDPAAVVVSKAPEIIDAHTAGGVITPRRRGGRFLAIPTPAARKMVRARRKATPRNLPATVRNKLRYVPRPNGPDLLVLDKGGQTKTGRFRKGSQTIVLFILVPYTRLRRRLRHWEKVADRIERRLPDMIVREYERAAA